MQPFMDWLTTWKSVWIISNIYFIESAKVEVEAIVKTNRILLECSYDLDSGELFDSIEWLKGQQSIVKWWNWTVDYYVSTAMFKRATINLDKAKRRYVLTIKNVTCLDEDSFTCQLAYNVTKNRLFKANAVRVFNVRLQPLRPSSLKWIPVTQVLQENDVVTFTCTGNVGKPAGTLQLVLVLGDSEQQPTEATAQGSAVLSQGPNKCTFERTSTLKVVMKKSYADLRVRCKPIYRLLKEDSNSVLNGCPNVCLDSDVINYKCATKYMLSCGENADCVNTRDSYACKCKKGFTGNGSSRCEDVDECAIDENNCSTNANCVNKPGTFACACKTGFSGDGTHCADTDECMLDKHDCDHNADCENTVGSYTCTCRSGFAGDGRGCAALGLLMVEKSALFPIIGCIVGLFVVNIGATLIYFYIKGRVRKLDASETQVKYVNFDNEKSSFENPHGSSHGGQQPTIKIKTEKHHDGHEKLTSEPESISGSEPQHVAESRPGTVAGASTEYTFGGGPQGGHAHHKQAGQSHHKQGGQSHHKPEVGQSHHKQGGQSHHKPEVGQSDHKQGGQSHHKPEVGQSDDKQGGQSHHKPEVGQSDHKQGGQSHHKPEVGQSDHKQGGQSHHKPEVGQSDHKHGGQSHHKPEVGQSDHKHGGHSHHKPVVGQSDHKQGGQSHHKPEVGQSDDKQGGQSHHKHVVGQSHHKHGGQSHHKPEVGQSDHKHGGQSHHKPEVGQSDDKQGGQSHHKPEVGQSHHKHGGQSHHKPKVGQSHHKHGGQSHHKPEVGQSDHKKGGQSHHKPEVGQSHHKQGGQSHLKVEGHKVIRGESQTELPFGQYTTTEGQSETEPQGQSANTNKI